MATVYEQLLEDYVQCVEQNRKLLEENTDLKIQYARRKKELDLYKAFSTDVTHELVARAIEQEENVCKT